MGKQRHLLIVAGETSGDNHAAELVREIKRLMPQVHISGLGGPQMKAAGVEVYEDLTRHAVIGFVEVLKHLSTFRMLFKLIIDKATQTQAEAVILVDYPGFNLRLAKALKKHGLKVIYYISPQVWAWKENRVKLIKSVVDKMIVLFPFEKEFYARHQVNAFYAGHPLIDSVKVATPKEKFLLLAGLNPGCPTLGLLPGSREKEVRTLLPLMVQSARLLREKSPHLQFVVAKAPSVAMDIYQKTIPSDIPIFIYENNPYDAINACDACLVASGTATLEVALLQKPLIVIYKTSFLTWTLANLLIKIPYIGLVNVVAGKKIVPECIQFEATPSKISQAAQDLLFSSSHRSSTIKSLEAVKQSLGTPGASQRAAKEIVNFLSQS